MIPRIYSPAEPLSGLILGMPNADYHRAPGISKSGLDRIALSPAHYRFAEPKESTRPMVIGTAIHCALLEPSRFSAEYVLLKDVDDRTKSEYKAAKKAHAVTMSQRNGGQQVSEEVAGEFVLSGPESRHIIGLQETLYSDSNTRKLLTAAGHREASLFVNDPVTGAQCRVRFDILGENGGIVDLKKTRDCRERGFQRAITEYRYHVAAAFYSDVYQWAYGEKSPGYALLAAEFDGLPHARKIWLPDEAAIVQGRKEYRADLNLYASCKESDNWPCYDSAPEFISLPDWAVEDEITTDDEESDA